MIIVYDYDDSSDYDKLISTISMTVMMMTMMMMVMMMMKVIIREALIFFLTYFI